MLFDPLKTGTWNLEYVFQELYLLGIYKPMFGSIWSKFAREEKNRILKVQLWFLEGEFQHIIPSDKGA